MTQAELAEAVNVSSKYVSVLERGEKLPTLDTLLKLAAAVHAAPGELLGDASEKDDWLDEVLAVARSVPPAQRHVVVAVVRAIATAKVKSR